MSSSVVGAAAVIDTSNVLYPTGGILLCLNKVKSLRYGLAISASYMRQTHSPTFGNKTTNIHVSPKSNPTFSTVT